MRIVEGAVKNVAHAHPDTNLSDGTARSIAKRAAGTLTAQWPDVLAVAMPSDSRTENFEVPSGPNVVKPAHDDAGWGPPQRSRRSPFPRIWSELGRLTADAYRAKQTERHAVLVEVFRLLSIIERETK